jgi:hypothetical protein
MPLFGQLRQDLVVQQRILARDDLAALLAGAVEVGGAQVVGRSWFLVLGQQAGHAHFEEFVEIAADDAQEAQALEQRHRRSSACSSTRRLNSSSDSSRLRKGAGASCGIVARTSSVFNFTSIFRKNFTYVK